MTHKLFSPFTLKSVALKNRIIMAPMTRCRAAEGDVPTALMATHYAQRATAGLIITEGTPVSPQGRGYLWTPGIYTAEQIAGWRLVTDAVHQADGKIFAQIWHVGRISHGSLLPDGGTPVGPTDEQSSDAVCFAFDTDGNPGNVPVSAPRAMDSSDIEQVKQEFVQAARNSIDADMDGVEIHGANGYLFDQFLNPIINTRSDAFTGCIILCGGYDADRAKSAIDRGLGDLIAFGAAYIANPDLSARLENGWPLKQPDPALFYGGGDKGYTDYPEYNA